MYKNVTNRCHVLISQNKKKAWQIFDIKDIATPNYYITRDIT